MRVLESDSPRPLMLEPASLPASPRQRLERIGTRVNEDLLADHSMASPGIGLDGT